VTRRNRADLVLHSEWAEQDGGGIQAPDSFDERFGAVRMIAVDQHSFRAFLPDRIVDAIWSVDELRLVTVELHHQTQQRADYLFARENQNVTHSDRSGRVVSTRQLADLWVLWRMAGNP
jgi:hypothetical protein